MSLRRLSLISKLTFSVCVISVVRLVVLSRLEAYDVTWNYVNAAIWSAAEPSMGVIAVCVPSLRPLIALVWKGRHRSAPAAMNGARTSASPYSSRIMWASCGKDQVQLVRRFTQLEDLLPTGDRDHWGHKANVHGGKCRSTAKSEEVSYVGTKVRLGGIRVKNEVIITSHVWDYKDHLY